MMKRILDWLLSRDTIANTGAAGSLGLLILRTGTGLTMAFGHGMGKLTSFGVRAANFPDPLGVGSSLSMGLTVFAEFFCALALVLGLFSRGVVIPLVITMTVAAFVIHGDDPFGKQELPLLFLTAFVTILFAGPGRYSVDRILRRH